MLGSTVSLSGRLNHRAGLGSSLQQVRFYFHFLVSIYLIDPPSLLLARGPSASGLYYPEVGVPLISSANR
jgi:hypothetical protein